MLKSTLDVAKLWIPTPKTYSKNKSKFPKNGKYNSLYGWLNTLDFNQSNRVKSGNYIQSFISELITHSPNNALIIKDKYIVIDNGKTKEMDIVFQLGDKIYYRETKTNFNLDSEKLPATFNKIVEIHEALSKNIN